METSVSITSTIIKKKNRTRNNVIEEAREVNNVAGNTSELNRARKTCFEGEKKGPTSTRQRRII